MHLNILLHHTEKSYRKYHIKVNEVECCISRNVIGFRGTEADAIDILRDLRIFPWYNKNIGWSHSGFLKGSLGILKSLEAYLDKEEPLDLVGHSLGGALALNVGLLLISRGYNVKGITTFGAPRSLLFGTAKKVRKRLKDKNIVIKEYYNLGDPVSSVPSKFLGYQHVNKIPTKLPKVGKVSYNLDNHNLSLYKKNLIK